MRIFLFLLGCFLFVSCDYVINVKGKVVDAESGLLLDSVYFHNTKEVDYFKQVTNTEGEFEVGTITGPFSVLEIEFDKSGYESQTLSFGSDDSVVVKLERDK